MAFTMTLPDDLSKCLVLNTISAARTLLRRYDAKLKPLGVTVQQFSLLAAIRFHPGEPVSTLAQRVFLDRTSLSRNLDLLERKRLVRRASRTVGNARICELTKRGNTLLDRLLPEWQESKSELMEGQPDQDAETYLRVAKHLSRE
jgi:DNA-binding MarR family transcriptional regulator